MCSFFSPRLRFAYLRSPVVEERCCARTVPSSTLTALPSMTLSTSGARWADVDDVTAQLLLPVRWLNPHLQASRVWVGRGCRKYGFHTNIEHPRSAHGRSLFPARPPNPAKAENKTSLPCAQLDGFRTSKGRKRIRARCKREAIPLELEMRDRNSHIFLRSIKIWEIFLPKVSCPKLN